ncbi:MAG: AI-2E family transporter [Chitinophagales bacterium]
MDTPKIAFSIIIFIGSIVILYVGQDFLIPLVIAIGAWFFFNAVANSFTKIKLKGKVLPLWSRYLLTTLSIGLFVFFLSKLISSNINDLQDNIAHYNENIHTLQAKLFEKLGIENDINIIPSFMSQLDIGSMISKVALSLSSILSNTFLIILYLIFLLIEQRMFGKKIRLIFKERYHDKVDASITKIKQSIESYILIKTMVSMLTGILSYIVLRIIGVDFAFFWAFLIFMLNYIPSVGSLIATVFPALLAIIQFDTLMPAVYVLIGIGVIQLVIGNFLEPKLFGNSLNISSLAVILSLTFWGLLWDVTGMFLCVPITVILMVVANNFEETKPIAILLSDDGEV